MNRLLRWRTVLVVFVGLVFLFAGYALAARCETLLGQFATYAGTIATLVGIAAAKSGVEHLAGGGGLQGAAKALLTAAKPEEPKS